MPKQVSLTDTRIRHAKPRDKEYSLSAGRGLYLRVTPAGTKSWLFNYFRPLTNKRSNFSLGRYPAVSLAQAQEKRDGFWKQLAQGLDPQLVKADEVESRRAELANTFGAVYDDWLALKMTTISDNYRQRIDGTMQLHVLPFLGKTPIKDLRAPAVIDSLRPVSNNRTFETLRKICGWINEVMVYAVNTGKIEWNPLYGIKMAFEAPQPQNYPTIRPEELPEFMRDLEASRATLQTQYAIELLLHTMVRPGEGASMRWDEIDFSKALWIRTALTMKKRRRHIIPLTPQVLNILSAMKRISGHRAWVFPSHIDPLDHMNEETCNTAIARMGYKGRLVAHGLRSIGSTALNEAGFDAELIEVSLSHVDSSVRGDYNRAEYVERRRAILQWWSSVIENAQRATGEFLANPLVLIPAPFSKSAHH